jgi:hypothetical protein
METRSFLPAFLCCLLGLQPSWAFSATSASYSQVAFNELSLTISLDKDSVPRLRDDGPVGNLDTHQRRIVDALSPGISVREIWRTPESRILSWQDEQATSWITYFTLSEADNRIAQARLTRAKFLALKHVFPVGASIVQVAVNKKGFQFEWEKYDTEFQADIVESMSLLFQGFPLEPVANTPLTESMASFLRAAMH